jgi:hypothetical protein
MKKGKTENMLFGTGKRLSTLNDRQMNLECNGSKVNFTSHYKYLGVHLKSSLNINDHVNKAFKKASGYLKLLAKTRSFLSTKASLDIYRAMVIPVLTYCSLVCTCSTTTQKKRLESFEKRGACSMILRGLGRLWWVQYGCLNKQLITCVRSYFRILSYLIHPFTSN